MSYGALTLVVLGAGFIGGLLSWLVRRKVRVETLRRHHEIGTAVSMQLGVVFAVLLAFVFNEVWSEYLSAARSIEHEAASLHTISLLAQSLPPPPRRSTPRLTFPPPPPFPLLPLPRPLSLHRRLPLPLLPPPWLAHQRKILRPHPGRPEPPRRRHHHRPERILGQPREGLRQRRLPHPR